MKDKNKDLMLKCGSKKGDYDPEAPDQWRWVLHYSKDPHERALAWIKSKTTAWKHESPFCVDEHGKPIYIEHMAVELGWEVQTARNVLAELQSQGRARVEKKRIWYCADIALASESAPASDNDQPEGGTKGEETNAVQRYFSAYVIDFVEKLPAETRVSGKRTLEAILKWRKEFFADTMANARNIADRYEDTTLEQIGIPKKRLGKRDKPPKTKWVQLELLEEDNSVQSYIANYVQRGGDSVQNGQPTLHKPKNGSVHSKSGGASFIGSSATSKPLTTTTADTPAFVWLDVVVVGKKLNDYDQANPAAGKRVNKFCADCRDELSDCTTEEVAHAIDRTMRDKHGKIRTDVDSPMGMLLSVVPGKLAAYRANPLSERSMAAGAGSVPEESAEVKALRERRERLDRKEKA